MIIHGQVLKVERVQGSGDSGNYDYFLAHVLDASAVRVERCRVSEEFGKLPKEGEMLTAEVYVSVYSTNQGQARMSFRLVRRVDPLELAADSDGVLGVVEAS